jgi:L-2-hydroxycarboxylate dehydrogenase (NAD+)
LSNADSLAATNQNEAAERGVTAPGESRVRNERTRFAPAELRAFVARALEAANVRPDDARLAAEVLVTSDVRGIESHGVARLERFYVDRIRDGIIDPQGRATTLRETTTSLAVDAGNALGHPVSVRTMRRTIDKAREAGCAVATVRHSNHYGIAGYYAMQALEFDCIGIASTNAGRLAVPTGGREVMLGTNPFAYAVPAQDGDAFVLDMATTTVALGKLEIAQRLGKALRPGWAIDAAGHPTTDPAAGIAGGLLPLGGFGTSNGGHKGYGLALLCDILCGVLGGGVFAAGMPPSTHMLDPAITSHFFAAIRIDAFRDVAAFKADVSALLRQFRESAPAPGASAVCVAGDPETARAAIHERDGVGLDPVVVASLERVAQKLNVTPPARLE